MPAGLLIVNTSGTVLIADTNPNYSLKSSGSGTTNGVGSLVVTVTGVQPVIAFRSGSAVFHRSTGVSGSTFTFTFASAVAGAVIEYWVFDVRGTPSAGNMGLQVFDVAGTLMFDSSAKIALVAGDMAFSADGQSIALPAGRAYAALAIASGRTRQGRTTLEANGFYTWEYRFFSPFLSYSGTTFSFSLIDDGWQYSSNEEVDMPALFKQMPAPQARCIFLDVTGY